MAGELIKAGKVLRIGQRVEFFVEDSDVRYASRIEDMTDNQLIVAMPMDSKRIPVIPRKGERLCALAVGDQCRYRFFSEFYGAGSSDNQIPVWYISRPQEVERHQNREFVRIQLNLPVCVRLVDEEGTIMEPISTRMVDLSGNGICFVLDHAVKIGSKAAVELSAIPELEAGELMCQIARCTRIDREDGVTVYHVGASFQHLSRAISNKIVRYLFGVQRTRIARGIIH